jgi:putative ABC transport system permease protein
MFGVLVASQSITGSAGAALHGIIGSARLQLSARSAAGFDEGVADRVRAIPGVRVAAPVLRGDAVLVGTTGTRAIQIIGVTPNQIELRGSVTRNLGYGASLLTRGVGLPSHLAAEVGVDAGGDVTVLSGGAAHSFSVSVALGQEAIGPIANSPVAVAQLPVAQLALGMPGRVSQVLIEPKPGARRGVEAQLRKLAAGRLNVQAADHELAVLRATAVPTNQSSKLFAAIGAIVGFLLAVNAMLLTVPERRRWISEQRTLGYSVGQISVVFGFQALALGLIASLAGVALGDVLARTLFGSVPSYLTLAFPVGSHPVVSPGTALLVISFGVFATLFASATPALDLLPGRPIDSVASAHGKAGQGIGRSSVVISAFIGLTLTFVVTLVVLVFPSLSVIGGVLLGVAVLCLVPCVLAVVVSLLRPISERVRGSMLAIGLIELEGTATRSIALAGVAALAIYGTVAVQGARHDLLGGLHRAVVQYLDTSDIWITTAGDNFLTVDAFPNDGLQRAIARTPGIASVRVYQGALLDVRDRRLWIRARPSTDRTMIQASQMLHGNLGEATRLLREGGWVAMSSSLASERHIGVGDAFVLATPTGTLRLRVAAITTNTGWPPGAITMNTADFQRGWHTTNPSALEVNLKPRTSSASAKQAIAALTGARQGGLLVQSRGERETQYEASAHQGVQSLSEISTLVLITAALAIAFALSATIAARTVDLAARKTEGYGSLQLWRSLLCESGVILAAGALTGALFGFFGHVLASRWLRVSQGFPAPFSPDPWQLVLALAFICAIALVVIGAVGVRASRVPPQVMPPE